MYRIEDENGKLIGVQPENIGEQVSNNISHIAAFVNLITTYPDCPVVMSEALKNAIIDGLEFYVRKHTTPKPEGE